MPLNFWIICLVQSVVLVSIALYKKEKKIPLLYVLIMSALFGIFIGTIFDVTNITLGIHGYFALSGSKMLLSSVSLTLHYLIVNGALSYGLASATMWYFAPSPKIVVSETKRISYIVICGLLFSLCLLSSTLIPSGTFWIMFAVGGSVLLFGEGLLLFFKKAGPIISLFEGHHLASFFRVWTVTIALGIIYETANHFFPFWMWLPGTEYSSVVIESLIIIFGYAVLFHPMIVFWQLVEEK